MKRNVQSGHVCMDTHIKQFLWEILSCGLNATDLDTVCNFTVFAHVDCGVAAAFNSWFWHRRKKDACKRKRVHAQIYEQVCSTFSLRAWNSLRKWGFSWKWKSKIRGGGGGGEKWFPWGENQPYFFFFFKKSHQCRQIEGTELIFIMNFSVLDFFKFASRMPQIVQILVSTFNNFWGWEGGIPLNLPRNFLFFFMSNSRLWHSTQRHNYMVGYQGEITAEGNVLNEFITWADCECVLCLLVIMITTWHHFNWMRLCVVACRIDGWWTCLLLCQRCCQDDYCIYVQGIHFQ